MAGESPSPIPGIVQDTVSLFKLCLSLSEVDVFMLYGIRFSFNHVMYFILPKHICILLKVGPGIA